MRKKFIIAILITIIVLLVSIGTISLINSFVKRGGGNVCNIDERDRVRKAALVLGAKVYSSGRLSDIFKDRVDTAIMLYNDKRVEKILISGDHGTPYYDEVSTAKEYLLEKGIPAQDIFLDHAGFDTYDSIYRAKEIFKVNSLIIVTQNFHLPRALFISNKLELDACGQSADIQTYVGEDQREFREIFARVKAWFNIALRSKPKFLGEQFPITGDGQMTWD